MKNYHRYLLIMAGGKGARMGVKTPKQFLPLAGRPVIIHSINRFLDYDPDIELIIVLAKEYSSQWKEICDKYNFTHPHQIAEGGTERYNSVKNGLALLKEKSLVAIHDAVRPLVSTATISRCFEMAAKRGNAIPVISPPESVREIYSADMNRPLQRDNIVLVQTPQIFRSELLLRGYSQARKPEFTDDATVIESLGEKINLVKGNPENIKITLQEDLVLAENLLKG